HQGRGLSFELGGKRTSLLAHQTPLSRRGFSPKSVSGISRPLQLPLSKFIHAAPSRASGQSHADCEPSVFDCKPLHLVRPFPQRMKSWPIYRQGQPSFDE
ncbi:TPA: hypothetical protein ACHQHX_005029, partial [Pseudomonas aeruginosa]